MTKGREHQLAVLRRSRGECLDEIQPADDVVVGIGGHLEPDEMEDPAAGALRELKEEIGVGPEQISGLALRYVSLRDTGQELRQTYYFTAGLLADVPVPSACVEGELQWFDLTLDPSELEMPPTSRVALTHWLRTGRHDQALRFITIDADGALTGPG